MLKLAQRLCISIIFLTLMIAIPVNSVIYASDTKEDINNDGTVDLLDIALLAKYFGTTNSDMNIINDNIIDIYDLVKVARAIEKGVWPERISGSNSQNNNSNGHFFTKVGEWIYYNNKVEGALYKIRTNGNDKTKLVNASINYMAVKGEYIYFVDSNLDGAVYRIKNDGTNYSKFSTKFTSNGSCSYINTYDNYIYFLAGYTGHVQKLSIDGKEGEMLTMQPTSPRRIYVWDNMMYYVNQSEDDHIYVMNLDNGDMTKINEIESTNLNKYNNYIYFSNYEDGNKIYRTMVGGTSQKICDDKTYGLNISDEWIYYTNASDGNKLYKIKVDGTNKQKLSDDSAFGINIVGDWVYYYTYGAKEVYVIKNDGSRKYKLS